MLNLVQLLSLSFTITMRPISAALLLFFSLMKDILSVKFRQELVWGRVLWEGLARKWRGTRKTILEGILPSCLLMINTLFFAKSPLESLIMPFKPPNSLILSSLILFYPKLSEEHSRMLVFTQQQRRKFLC